MKTLSRYPVKLAGLSDSGEINKNESARPKYLIENYKKLLYNIYRK